MTNHYIANNQNYFKKMICHKTKLKVSTWFQRFTSNLMNFYKTCEVKICRFVLFHAFHRNFWYGKFHEIFQILAGIISSPCGEKRCFVAQNNDEWSLIKDLNLHLLIQLSNAQVLLICEMENLPERIPTIGKKPQFFFSRIRFLFILRGY